MTIKKVKAKTIRPQMATVLLIVIVAIAAIIFILWAIGIGIVTDLFAYLNLLQEQPPMWVEAPMVMSRFLLLPSIVAFLVALVITRVSPEPRFWSRSIVIGVLLYLTLRYVEWRSLATLNLSNPLDRSPQINGINVAQISF